MITIHPDILIETYTSTNQLCAPKDIQCKITNDGCWEVVSHKPHSKGYICLHRKGRKYLLHRLMYEYWFGSISDGQEVCHTCDNPLCINPNHLWLGTHLENMHDMIHKHRQRFRSHCKLTEHQVRAIRADTLSTQKQLAQQYGVHQAHISDIKNYKRWVWVT